jgi:glycosyltransferase involved in cell wall biosynthesis
MSSPSRPLRVALVHSYYSSQQPSGENIQVDTELVALRRAGVDAHMIGARTDDLEGERGYRLRTAARVASRRGRSPLVELQDFAPDVVHVHNLFPNFGRTWVTDLDVPLVVTLHNFRTVCASGSLFRDGHLCTDCPDGRPWSGVRHRCYRDSMAATLPVTISQRGGPQADPVLRRADRVLCLSSRQRRMLIGAGLEERKVVDWSNFLPDDLRATAVSAASVVRPAGDVPLFVGRLSSEKSCLDLLRSWPLDAPLRVVGDGPLSAEVRRLARPRQVELIPRLPRSDVLALMQRSSALIIPSGCPEGQPLAFLEALACGLPVIVRRVCDLADVIEDAGVGLVVNDMSDVGTAVDALAQDRAGFSARCRDEFHHRYTESAWIRRTTALYRTLTGGPGAVVEPSTTPSG